MPGQSQCLRLALAVEFWGLPLRINVFAPNYRVIILFFLFNINILKIFYVVFSRLWKSEHFTLIHHFPDNRYRPSYLASVDQIHA
jgi:hypothetical protein